MRISVVLPAPFSPTMATISPAATSSDTSSSAQFAPKDFVMSRIVSNSEFAARNFERAVADRFLDPLHFRHRGRRDRLLQRFVPDQRHDPVLHPEPLHFRFELMIA